MSGWTMRYGRGDKFFLEGGGIADALPPVDIPSYIGVERRSLQGRWRN
jgi:hypothetical protein